MPRFAGPDFCDSDFRAAARASFGDQSASSFANARLLRLVPAGLSKGEFLSTARNLRHPFLRSEVLPRGAQVAVDESVAESGIEDDRKAPVSKSVEGFSGGTSGGG